MIEEAQHKSTNAKVRYQWARHLGPAYCGSLLGRPVHEITTVDVTAVLKPIWNEKPEVARKLYPAIRRVFEYARIRLRDDRGIAMPDNPARWDDLKAMGFESPTKLSRGSHPSLPHERLPSFIVDLRARDAIAARALEFLILTNVRTDAVLKVKWDELKLDQALWSVQLANLKDRKHRKEAFRVPLSARAVTAATAFISIALASSAVPPVCCAKAVGENIRTAADTAAIIDVRSMAFLLFCYIAMREMPVNSAKRIFPASSL